MKLSKLYTDSRPGPILFQGLVGIVTGLVLAALYSLFAHENGLRRFAFAIVALPVTLAALKLLFYLGNRGDRNAEAQPLRNPPSK